MKLAALFATFLILLTQTGAQDRPDKIRGYKISDARVTVANSSGLPARDDRADAFVKLTDPRIAGIGLVRVHLEIGAEITATRQSGRVEFLTFRDFRVNGITVDVEEHRHSFSFKKWVSVMLPKPARVSISLTSLPRAAYNELMRGTADLAVTGTVFVFGKFKKFGFSFKRVVPIKVDLKLKHPLRA